MPVIWQPSVPGMLCSETLDGEKGSAIDVCKFALANPTREPWAERHLVSNLYAWRWRRRTTRTFARKAYVTLASVRILTGARCTENACDSRRVVRTRASGFKRDR